MTIRITRVLAVLGLLALGLAGCGGPDVDWQRAVGDLAGGACRATESCTVVCGDGSTLDGRPSYARCR